jgi:hypothetical protein
MKVEHNPHLIFISHHPGAKNLMIRFMYKSKSGKRGHSMKLSEQVWKEDLHKQDVNQ